MHAEPEETAAFAAMRHTRQSAAPMAQRRRCALLLCVAPFAAAIMEGDSGGSGFGSDKEGVHAYDAFLNEVNINTHTNHMSHTLA